MGLFDLFWDRKRGSEVLPEGDFMLDPEGIVPEPTDEKLSIKIENSQNVTIISGSNLNIFLARKDRGRFP
jgi:hypothetical protein